MTRNFLVILLFLFCGKLTANINLINTAQAVLDDLYDANGNTIIKKPTLRITVDDKNAALYLRRSNVIELSEKAYRSCQAMGKDSLSALAYIVGHELAHAFQDTSRVPTTNFLAYHHHHGEGIFFEELADIQGVFIAYLAGYNTLEIMPTLIEKIYDEFDLSSDIKGYPTLQERQNTTIKVQELTQELIHLYEMGNYLLVLELSLIHI